MLGIILKLAVNGHKRTNNGKYDSLYYQLLMNNKDIENSNVNSKKLKYFIAFCQQLHKQCGQNPICGNNKCGNMIVRNKKNRNILISKHTCRGCKVMMYCSRKCQKIDWIARHRKQCIVFALQELSCDERRIVMQMKNLLHVDHSNVL